MTEMRGAPAIAGAIAVAVLTAILLPSVFRHEGGDAAPFLVAIDAGHGPGRAGTTSASGRGEYWFNEEIALRLLTRLAEMRIVSFIVGERDPDLSLPERVESVRRRGADLLISIHHDSVQPRYLVRAIGPAGEPLHYSDYARGFSLFVALGGDRDSLSLHFARSIAERLVEAGLRPTLHHAEPIPGEDRELVDRELGIYHDDGIYVLREVPVPAVLLECGMIVHPEEEKLLRSEPHRRLVVEAVAAAISDYASRRVTAQGARARSARSSQP